MARRASNIACCTDQSTSGRSASGRPSSSQRFSAQEALAAGIVNRVVPVENFDAAVSDWAEKLAGKSPVIMRLGKEAMRRQLDMPFDDALDYLRAQLTLALSTEDIVEGVTAFFEKREPQWKGR